MGWHFGFGLLLMLMLLLLLPLRGGWMLVILLGLQLCEESSSGMSFWCVCLDDS
jgi:hypothetical protein